MRRSSLASYVNSTNIPNFPVIKSHSINKLCILSLNEHLLSTDILISSRHQTRLHGNEWEPSIFVVENTYKPKQAHLSFAKTHGFPIMLSSLLEHRKWIVLIFRCWHSQLMECFQRSILIYISKFSEFKLKISILQWQLPSKLSSNLWNTLDIDRT